MPSHLTIDRLASFADDRAALGNAAALWWASARAWTAAEQRLRRTGGVDLYGLGPFGAIGSYLGDRASAVEARLAGRVEEALAYEHSAERTLEVLALADGPT
jgi:hypothetical protein